jgi:hypothetical protein
MKFALAVFISWMFGLCHRTASCDYKGDITRDGGTDCWYDCA